MPSTRQICPCPLPAAREEMSAKGLQGLVAVIVCGALCDGDTLRVSALVLRLKNVSRVRRATSTLTPVRAPSRARCNWGGVACIQRLAPRSFLGVVHSLQ